MRPGRPNTTGAPGVARPKRGGYPAVVRVNGIDVSLGRYDSIEEAALACLVAGEALSRGEVPFEDDED